MANLPATRIENLVDFQTPDGEVELVSYTGFNKPGDVAVLNFKAQSTQPEFIEYTLVLNDDLNVELLNIEAESKDGNDGEVIRSGYQMFNPALELTAATKNARHIESALRHLVKAFDNEINELVVEIKGDRWKATRGHYGPDRQYAVLAKLFVTLHRYYFDNALIKFADLLEIPYETAKHRIRTTKEKGFLTTPGKGSTNTQLTDKAKDLVD